jgi:CRP/FNR family transcriptional regulator, cyclic AMP receptor protein
MSMRTLDELIAASPVFVGLHREQLEVIAGCAFNEHFEAGTQLFAEGREANRFYLIREGAISLEVQAPGRGRLVIETVHAGDVVGWSWLFEPYRWHLDGYAAEALRVVSFDGACLLGKCEADHELGYALMRRFAAALIDRLQATRVQLLDVYGHA